MLEGYFDTWIIDLAKGTIFEPQQINNNVVYVGVFKGGGSKPWKFYLASEQKEQKLEPRGG